MSFGKFVTSLDAFGEPVSLNYNGETRFKTKVGAIVSILIKSFLLVYTAQQFLDLVNYQDPKISIVSITSTHYDSAMIVYSTLSIMIAQRMML